MRFSPANGYLYLPETPEILPAGLAAWRYDYYFSLENTDSGFDLEVTTRIIFAFEKIFTCKSVHQVELGEIHLCIKECLLSHFLKLGISRSKANLVLKDFRLDPQKKQSLQAI